MNSSTKWVQSLLRKQEDYILSNNINYYSHKNIKNINKNKIQSNKKKINKKPIKVPKLIPLAYQDKKLKHHQRKNKNDNTIKQKKQKSRSLKKKKLSLVKEVIEPPLQIIEKKLSFKHNNNKETNNDYSFGGNILGRLDSSIIHPKTPESNLKRKNRMINARNFLCPKSRELFQNKESMLSSRGIVHRTRKQFLNGNYFQIKFLIL